MITRGGIGTLAAGGGIVAVVVCLLVGIQLLMLGSEIGTLIQADPASVDSSTRAWQALIRVSGLLTLMAAALILLLVTAHRQGWRSGRSDQGNGGDPEIEDISVRIFEVDPSRKTIEVPASDESRRIERPTLAKTPFESADTATEDILGEIDRVAGGSPPDRSASWRRFLARFFGK